MNLTDAQGRYNILSIPDELRRYPAGTFNCVTWVAAALNTINIPAQSPIAPWLVPKLVRPSGPLRPDGATNPGNNIRAKTSSASAIPSPIVLDLDVDGVETTSVSSGDAYFDHAADGFAERTGWVGADDGLLVRDFNGNGQIDSGRELFGSETLAQARVQSIATGYVNSSYIDPQGNQHRQVGRPSDCRWNRAWRPR